MRPEPKTETEINRLLHQWPCYWCGGSTPIYPTNHSDTCRGRILADERGLTRGGAPKKKDTPNA